MDIRGSILNGINLLNLSREEQVVAIRTQVNVLGLELAYRERELYTHAQKHGYAPRADYHQVQADKTLLREIGLAMIQLLQTLPN